jgi:hypothetical protein
VWVGLGLGLGVQVQVGFRLGLGVRSWGGETSELHIVAEAI